MRLKQKWTDLCCKLFYCFRPVTVILACLVFMFVIDAVCIFFLIFTSSEVMRDIVFAILTGVTASVLVAVMVEIANNYQRNNKRWLQMSRLFSGLTHYEREIEIRKSHYEAEPLFCDRVRCIFTKLPELIPLIEDAYRNHCDVFRRAELESMYGILMNYTQIKEFVFLTLMEQSTLKFGKDPKNSGDLIDWLPKRLKKDLDKETLLCLAEDEWKTKLKQVAEILTRQGSASLDCLGIKIGDDMILENGPGDDAKDTRRDNVPGRIISSLVNEIDGELLRLQKIIKAEPGFSTIFDYYQNCSNWPRY